MEPPLKSCSSHARHVLSCLDLSLVPVFLFLFLFGCLVVPSHSSQRFNSRLRAGFQALKPCLSVPLVVSFSFAFVVTNFEASRTSEELWNIQPSNGRERQRMGMGMGMREREIRVLQISFSSLSIQKSRFGCSSLLAHILHWDSLWRGE